MKKSNRILIIVFSLIAFWGLVLLFDTNIYQHSGIKTKLPEKLENTKKVDLSHAFYLYINKQNQIIVADKIVAIKELSLLVENYYKENKSQSMVVLKYDLETRYDIFISAQDAVGIAINKLRDKTALEKYNKEFNLLDEKESKIIKALYPKNIKIQN